MNIWVDTDFGFDDLWAILLLKHSPLEIDGISLVAGNVPLEQVCKNAFASKSMFDLSTPITIGAAKPVLRQQETAERILGSTGMPTRGRSLSYSDHGIKPSDLSALVDWLQQAASPRKILALGPLTNLARIYQDYPQAAQSISKITWMGGARGRGNHTEAAEFNAYADAEALDILVQSKAPLYIVDLEICRQINFTEADCNAIKSHMVASEKGKLLFDLLGGYLDIALSRGRDAMSIYDPLAALGALDWRGLKFQPSSLKVNISASDQYGRTYFDEAAGSTQLASSIEVQTAKEICLKALVKEAGNA